MGHPRFSTEEIGRRGREMYERLRPMVETDENIGKLISIDIETGDYAIGDDVLSPARELHQRHPGAAVFGARIGYYAVYAFGTDLVRTSAR